MFLLYPCARQLNFDRQKAAEAIFHQTYCTYSVLLGFAIPFAGILFVSFCIWPLWLRGTLSCRTSSFIVGTGFLPLKPWNKLLPWKGTPCDSIYTMKFPGELQSKQFCIAVFTALGWHGATHQHSVFLRNFENMTGTNQSIYFHRVLSFA